MPLFRALAKLLAAGYTFLAEFHLCVVSPLCQRRTTISLKTDLLFARPKIHGSTERETHLHVTSKSRQVQIFE